MNLLKGLSSAPSGAVYFSDITFSVNCADEFGQRSGRIMKYDPGSGETRVLTSNSGQANGLAFDPNGWLVAAEGASYGGRRIGRYNLVTGEYRVIVDEFRGRKLNSPNDLIIDRKGRIYFTDPRYVGKESIELPLMGDYRVDGPNKIKRIIKNVSRPNGIALSPDERTLYVSTNDDGSSNWLEAEQSLLDSQGQSGIICVFAR